MQRITISVEEGLAEDFDVYVAARGYQSRSEGVRDLVREAVERWRDETAESAHCVGVLSYVFNPETRALAQRLVALQQAHHDLIVAVTQTALDHHHSLASMILRGETAQVRALADQIRAERGVRFGAVNLVGVDPGHIHHHPGAGAHEHAHMSPRAG